ncbi:tRNA lysidine(34) synthetase TilS [Microbulbifer epialgicus]|uniref:tRNA(Ile)-lysidine synthase n=1 Tax=Microbulbifer epialgicus TaxID=393907 RepID=A0ABV4NX35_9GAMM
MTTPASHNGLPALLQAALHRHPAQGRLWLGFSGGLDSTVLLHLLVSCKIPVQAVHVHHGLSVNADRWQAQCRQTAAALGVCFTSVQVQVDRGDGGLEQGARSARYRAFSQVMSAGDQILLGHHGDDQAETFILRLMRGAGVLGLSGMQEWRPMDEGKTLLRPLLKAGRSDLEAWARDHGLSWIEDESNNDESLERNYIRRRIQPLLAARWPARQQIVRAVENLRESVELLQEFASEDLKKCGLRDERLGQSLAIEPFAAMSGARRKNLLRNWVLERGGTAPESASLSQALEQVFNAAVDARIEVALGGLVVRRYQNRLYLTPVLPPLGLSGEGQWHWDGSSDLNLPGGGVLAPTAGWPASDYEVCYRRGGERAHPVGRAHSQTLKKLLQERGLEPWLRDRVPLVYRARELLAVGDLFTCRADTPAPPRPPSWRFFD